MIIITVVYSLPTVEWIEVRMQ
jgi:hypothetical protein